MLVKKDPWMNEFTFVTEGRKTFLVLGGEIVKGRIVGGKCLNKDTDVIVKDVASIPMTVMKISRPTMTLLNKSDDPDVMYRLLSQYLHDVDIRECFNELWVRYRNYASAKCRMK